MPSEKPENKSKFFRSLDPFEEERHNERMRTVVLSAVLMMVASAAAFAETEQSSRRVEETKRQLLDEAPSRTVAHVDRFSFETGGWINYRFSDYKNSDNDKSSEDDLSRTSWGDLRCWGRFIYRTEEMAKEKQQHSFYIRLKDVYTARSGVAPGERFDNRGPLLDQAYGTIDLRPWKVEAGRRYFNIGRGISYSGVHDGIQINYLKPGWNIGFFLSRTQPNESNIDTSVPGYEKGSLRYFSGLGVGYAGIKGHQIYGYVVAEQDRSREKPEDIDQDYNYNAEYYGLGAKGQWNRHWPYWVEVIRETGKSREDSAAVKSDIRSWAMDAEQKYLTLWRSGLALSAEYAVGSGDSDRASVTDTVGGNWEGRDRNFLYFGYLPTGIALAPRLSNIRMARLGADVNPFYFMKALQKMALGIDYYRYWKDRTAGGIYDSDATVDARSVGHEIDLRLDWRVRSWVLWSAEWGHFMSGKAYPDSQSTSTDVFSSSLTVIF